MSTRDYHVHKKKGVCARVFYMVRYACKIIISILLDGMNYVFSHNIFFYTLAIPVVADFIWLSKTTVSVRRKSELQ